MNVLMNVVIGLIFFFVSNFADYIFGTFFVFSLFIFNYQDGAVHCSSS